MLKILNRYYPLRNLIFFFVEGLLIFVAVIVSAYIRGGGDVTLVASYNLLVVKSLLVTAVCQLCLYYNELYDFKIITSNLELFIRLLQAIGAAYIILACLYYAFPTMIVGRGIFLINLFLLIFFLVSWRLVYNWILRSRAFDQKVLIVGAGKLAQKLAEEIESKKDSGFQIVGFVDSSPAPGETADSGFPILGTYEQIPAIVRKEGVEKIVVALQERRGSFPTNELLQCKLEGISVIDGVSFYEKLAGQLLVESLNPSWLIFSEGFRKSRVRKAVKRLSGIGISLIGIILSLPLLIITALAIRIESPGSVIYRQERVGENGKIFEVLKFRSMIDNAEPEGEAVWAAEEDPRITRVGRIIRKLRIDEVPQMFNVLRGDMNFVGPRPERPEFVKELAKAIPYYAQRHAVKPGITGWAQIRYPYGSSIEDAREKLHYDLYYIKNMSVVFDVLIVFDTIKIVLFGTGAR